MIETTLVTGPTASRREAAIARVLEDDGAGAVTNDPSQATAIVAEGFPTGQSGEGLDFLACNTGIILQRIAAGCLCCTGSLTMRVTLNRVLRQKPARLYIALSSTDHLAQIRATLSTAPYDQWLRMTADLHA